ncbi:MAG TPA: PAS-domain containing protein, partial [Longimicrobiaceae bacterium]|nr:PAS-domain containing protein [Longimicrobiaceae bacterium]
MRGVHGGTDGATAGAAGLRVRIAHPAAPPAEADADPWRERAVEAERELEGTRAVLRALLESTSDGILMVDGAGRITHCNQRFRDLWRIAPEVADTGDDATVLASAAGQLVDPEAFRRRVLELNRDPHAESHEVLEFRDGRVFERYSQPLRAGGRTVGRVWSFSDATENRFAERVL